MLKHYTSPDFWEQFYKLPKSVQDIAKKNSVLLILAGCTTEAVHPSTKPIKPSCGIYLPNTPYIACPAQEQPKTKQPVSNYKPKPKQQVIPKSQPPIDKPVVVKRAKGFSCDGKSTCGQMNSCAEARFYLNSCGVRKLDKDDDGIPCESICN